MVKFKKGYDSNDTTKNDLTQIEIALTDFGMADADSKGGTPVYASPECFEKTDTKSDVFSFGRLILFLLLTKEQFMKWLYIPIKNQVKIEFRNHYLFFENYSVIKMIFKKADSTKLSMIANRPGTPLELVTKMTKVTERINLRSARTIFNKLRTSLKIKLPVDLTSPIDGIIINNMTSTMDKYAKSAIR